MRISTDHYTACLLGGAIGDALGAPAEFMSYAQITSRYGKEGVTDYVEFANNRGRFTDDTQMALFTAEGFVRMIRFNTHQVKREQGIRIIYESYLHWLLTQEHGFDEPDVKDAKENSWLLTQKMIYSLRSPGVTCLGALRSGQCGTTEHPINNSKGCGGVMRAAPAGLAFCHNAVEAFNWGADAAAITHSHPDGYLPAGALAAIISFLCQGLSLDLAVKETLLILEDRAGKSETLKALEQAVSLYEKSQPSLDDIERLGRGWTGEEALAISVYCALQHPESFEKAVILSVNHGGDSDSTGSITGNIVGLMVRREGIPEKWIRNLEGADIVMQIAEELHSAKHIRQKAQGSPEYS